MIRVKVTSGSRRKVIYVEDDFIDAPKPDRTQMKKEAEEFIEYIRTEHKKVEAEVPNNTKDTWEDEALEEVLSKLRAIPDSYEGFVQGIYTYVRKKPERLEKVMNYINNNKDVTSSDVVAYVMQQPDFHEDGVYINYKPEKQLIEEGLQALEERLGVVGTMRFLQLFDDGGSGDYTKEKYEKEDELTEREMEKLLSEWLAEGKETT